MGANGAGIPLAIGSDADLAALQSLVARVNAGGQIALSYDGAEWRLAVA